MNEINEQELAALLDEHAELQENMNNGDQNLVLKQAWNDGVAQNFEVCQWLSNNAEAQGWDNSFDETGWSVLLKRQSLFA